MKRTLVAALLGAALSTLATLPLQAQTLRWASAGDPQTMDPVSQNESFTNAVNHQIYEFLVERDKKLAFVPGLATEWKQDGPLKWTFKLRKGVKFHDGRPFTADDVVFSVQRALEKTSQIAAYASGVGTPKKIDDHTVEFNLAQVNPIFLDHLNTIFIMSKAWCEEHKATKPQDFANKEEAHTAFNANGTGPYMLVSRQPDVKTVLKRNPAWWGKFEGNVQEVIYTPIKNDATRMAALISGEVDFVLDPPPRDLDKLRENKQIKVVEGPENRVVFIGMDQARDELLYSSVKGKNPFKDLRVRKIGRASCRERVS
jgi:peptide/nickel transport system substrate-binding protein